ncbi:MAG: ATP-binding protein [Bacteroidales bacterium]|nr:ATP-binding protein [Bacteroidales bacterium]MBQ5891554.1 ATP-binding protein [Bacteroidales bacterium]MEE1220874.1 ATP-binding protein [Bacteroidales bacterium]MEE1323384.1 ATP-binding protein [Bacteroidales bacterium]
MRIERKRNLQRLINSRQNGQIKIITGVRRCGKSYLLGVLYRDYLLQDGVLPEQIISIELDNDINIRYRNPLELGNYIRDRVSDKKTDYYILLDEIQMVESIDNPFLPKGSGAKITFVDVLLGLKSLPNVDVYVTGSNSKMLSSDVATAFRDRGEQIHITPLTYEEFYAAYPNDKRYAWREFMTYGGMPFVLHKNTHEEKSKYLQDLFRLTYIKDVIERNRLRANVEVIDELLNVVASSVGSLSNPSRLSNTFQSVKGLKIKNETISSYLDCFIDAYILSKAYRYDIKGRSYIDTPLKYYFTDIGLRNARLNFRQQEENHIMENILYNELIARDFNIDVGVVEYNHLDENGKKVRSQLEVDFVVNKTDKRYYIQSALTVANEEKRKQETNSLNRIDDSYTKIVIVRDNILPWIDDKGVQYINIEDFLLERINVL